MSSQFVSQSKAAHHRDELLAALETIGPLRRERVTLPGIGQTFEIVRPAEFDRLLDVAADDPEQNLPYWAELWPSGIALAATVLRNQQALRGKRALELGCGLGVTAIAAVRAGADLLVTDYASEALALCTLNVLDQTGLEPASLQINWRDPTTASLVTAAGNGFPVVLAADVLYEERDIEPLLALVERIVAPNGELWLAEPGRRPAARFLEALRERGWSGPSEVCAGPWPDPEDNRKSVVVGVHRLARVNC
jgi:predicted nicotinamide N-methyase